MRPQVILLGAPGSGKGTQANRLVTELGYNHLSTGDLLRKEIAEGSDLGKRVQTIMDEGRLVDDQTVLELLQKNCDLKSSSYIFDGFPRNLEQAKALDDVVLKSASSLALYFDINLDLLKDRLVNRRTCSDCGAIYNLLTKSPKKEGVCDACGGALKQRKDDNEETVKNRLEVFKSAIEPVLEYYEGKGELRRVAAEKAPEDVFEQIKRVVG